MALKHPSHEAYYRASDRILKVKHFRIPLPSNKTIELEYVFHNSEGHTWVRRENVYYTMEELALADAMWEAVNTALLMRIE